MLQDIFPVKHIRTVFDHITKLLDKDLLEFLDSVALDVFNSGAVKRFPYKSVSETLSLVLVSLLRELVKKASSESTNSNRQFSRSFNLIIVFLPFVDLESTFIKEIQAFVKTLFLSGQNDLQARDHEASEKEEAAAAAADEAGEAGGLVRRRCPLNV